jgi:hypothetical protein
LEIRPLTARQNLKTAVDAYLKKFEGLSVPTITRVLIELGREPAEALEVVPGHEGSRDVFMLRGATLFHFLFMPSVRGFPQAAAAVNDLYMTVTASFSFLMATP